MVTVVEEGAVGEVAEQHANVRSFVVVVVVAAAVADDSAR